MRKYTNFKDIAERLWDIENKLDLLTLKIDEIHIWQIVRMEVFTILLDKLLNLGEYHKSSSLSHKLKKSFKIIYNSIFSNPYFAQQCDTIIFPHDRVINVDNEYIDIYTQYLVNDLKEDNADILVLEKPYAQIHYTKKEKYIKYLDYSILGNAVSVKFGKFNIDFDENKISLIEKEFIKRFDVKIDIKDIFDRSIKKYKYYYKYYYRLLTKLCPKKIYVVVSYAYPWLVKAAKDLNIEVIELQHGTFSKYHLGYSYPYKKENLVYFPDKFLVWNQYWRDILSLPIKKENIIIHPFKFQQLEMRKYKNIRKVNNQVIVLSQGMISNQLAKVILDNYSFFEDKIIKYKLHPGEFQYYKKYKYLDILNQYDNVEIILESNLYELLAQSEYQVGVSSTALYEGIEFGLKTILADLPSVEYMKKLIENNMIYKVIQLNE